MGLRNSPLGKRIRTGAIAQLGERLNGIQEVGGSIPPGSTIKQRLIVHCGSRIIA
jgi:hypothetical protein